MKNKYIILQVLVIMLVFLFPLYVQAQIDGVPGNPDSAPIDGGLSLLVAGGVGYGIKKIREKRKENSIKF